MPLSKRMGETEAKKQDRRAIDSLKISLTRMYNTYTDITNKKAGKTLASVSGGIPVLKRTAVMLWNNGG